MSRIKSVILCGGAGIRLWPLSREAFPKQFLTLVNGKSLLQLTIERVKNFSDVRFVTAENYRFLVKDICSDTLIESGDNQLVNILLEPMPKNTAPAITLAALSLDVVPDDLLLFLPADHYIPDIDLFEKTIKSGIPFANSGHIVTFGVLPTYASTQYGYIHKGKFFTDHNGSDGGYKVIKFIEKPSLQNAQLIYDSGDYLWNSGIFLCKASVLISALSDYAKATLDNCRNAMEYAVSDDIFIRPSREFYSRCDSVSIDYAVMENHKNIVVIPFLGEWSDVGGWDAVAKLSEPDDFGNRFCGDAIFYNSTETYVNSEKRTVVSLGVDNLVIVDTEDALLVSSKKNLPLLKQVVTELRSKNIPQVIHHKKVSRPWGWYESLDEGDTFQVKRILVKKNRSLSLQLHQFRSEHWVVIKGLACVTNGNRKFLLNENESTYIAAGERHRLENVGDCDLEIIEVQSGSYLGEDDIVRFDDEYGRI